MLYLGFIVATLLSVVVSVPATSNSSRPDPNLDICLEQPPGGFVASVTPNVNLTTSKWIWTSEETPGPGASAPMGQRVFRKDFSSPLLKFPVCATIVMAADNTHDLYVNGVKVGSGNSFTNAVVTTTALNWFFSNSFIVVANNTVGAGQNPAGVIGTIMITYSDGDHEFIVTDGTWKTFLGGLPPGATDPDTDDSSWSFAVVQGTDGSQAFWPKVILPSALNGAFQSGANWIWSNEGNPKVSLPIESRGFRKTISGGSTCGYCAQVVISADDAYTLYMNGDVVGSANNWTTAQYYTITGLNGPSEVFAINGSNLVNNSPAGVIASILIAYEDGTTTVTQTDGSWKALTGSSPPAGFQAPGFVDSAWPAALVEGPYGSPPYGAIVVPQA